MILTCDIILISNSKFFFELTIYYIVYSFFFLNQQFITQHTKVDHGSYFITMYRRTILHEGKGTDRKRGWEKTKS